MIVLIIRNEVIVELTEHDNIKRSIVEPMKGPTMLLLLCILMPSQYTLRWHIALGLDH